jgi:hemolysin activation/secretion protein
MLLTSSLPACSAALLLSLALAAPLHAQPAAPFPAAVSTSATAEAPAAAPAPQPFDLLEFEIVGNSVLPVLDIERAVTPFLGPAGGMAQVEAARSALERAYQQAGFLTVFVDIPEQQVSAGVVRLKVVQGRIDRLRVVGSRYFSQGLIRETVAELAEGSTPNFNAVQRQLAELNRSDERSVQPVLRPGRLPGTVEVDLQVQDSLPASASVELNNKHAAGTSDWRLAASGRYNNLWQRGHSVGLTLSTAPQALRESQLLVLNYGVPLADLASLAFYAVASDSLTEPLTAVTVAGKGLSLGARYLRPLPPLPGFSHGLTLGVDFKDFQTQVATAEAGVLTPLRYLPFQLGYNAQWSGSGNASSSLASQIVFALHRFFARDVACASSGLADQFSCSGVGTDGSFAYWRGDLRHSQPLPLGGLLGLRLGWQFSATPLVGNERMVLGGVDSVRGYLEAEASGDRGLLASAEWRTANLGGAKGLLAFGGLDEATAYGFVDAGETRVLNARAGQRVHQALRSVGLGLQWRVGKVANGAIDIGWPLVGSGATTAQDARLHLRLAYTL